VVVVEVAVAVVAVAAADNEEAVPGTTSSLSGI
jgi:hypothetical protein